MTSDDTKQEGGKLAMSTRIDGSGGPPTASVRGAVERVSAKDGAEATKGESLRRDLVSTFKAAFRLDVTGDVLSEIRDRLVTLRAGLQVSTDGEERRAFVKSTLGSISQLVDMTELGPVEWPDVPPRNREPGEVLSPLEQSLAQTLETQVAIPELGSRDIPQLSSEELRAAATDALAEAEEPTVLVDRAISKIDAARRQLNEARSEVGARAADFVDGQMRASGEDRPRFFDAELAEAAARSMRDRFTADPESAVRAMGKLDPESVLTLVA